MQTNQLPDYDDSVNTTGCCARFNPEGWDGQELHFKDKKFVRAVTRSAMHIPLNMGSVFGRVHGHIQKQGAYNKHDFAVLSHDTSAWGSEHLFAVSKDVKDEEMTSLSGKFFTKVFEGPYRNAKQWDGELDALTRAKGHEPKSKYFFYTTCPKCAKAYGKNYVVGFAEV